MGRLGTAATAITFALGAAMLPAGPASAADETCFKHPATFVGTDGPDVVTPEMVGPDAVIVTLGGDDTITVPGGNVRVCTGAGDDAVDVDPETASPVDWFRFRLGIGNDRASTPRGEAVGGPGDDEIYGGRGTTTLLGNGGNDVLIAEGSAALHGGDGDDTVSALGSSADTVAGGPGADTIDARGKEWDDGRYVDDADVVDGGSGADGEIDICDLNPSDVASGCEDEHISEICANQLSTIEGTEGDDVLEGTPADDVIVGRTGHDEVDGNGGHDVVCLGAGNDVARGAVLDVLGGPGGDVIRGASSASGGGGDDVIVGVPDGSFANLRGEAGDDVIRGPSPDGLDALSGGPGDDLLDTVDRDPVTHDPVEAGRADSVDGDGGADRCVVNAVDDTSSCEVAVRGR